MPYQKSVLENVFGIIGTICWTGQLIPQVWKSYRCKTTTGLSHWLVFLWGASAVFQGVYALLQQLNIPLMVQPQLFGFLSFVSWGQCQYYGAGRSRWAATLLTLSVIVFSGLLELMLVILLRPPHDRGEHAATTATKAFGILSSVIISAALFPQYWQIYKHKAVIGISLPFISIDLIGGVFNVLSLAFRAEFDIIAAMTYSLVVVLDGVIIIAALILNPIARKKRELQAQQGALAVTREPNTQVHTTQPLSITPIVDGVGGCRPTAVKEFDVVSKCPPDSKTKRVK